MNFVQRLKDDKLKLKLIEAFKKEYSDEFLYEIKNWKGFATLSISSSLGVSRVAFYKLTNTDLEIIDKDCYYWKDDFINYKTSRNIYLNFINEVLQEDKLKDKNNKVVKKVEETMEF